MAKPGIDYGNEELSRLGKALITRLFILCKTSLHYGGGHAALKASAANALTVVLDILRVNEEASLRLRWEHFYLGDRRLKQDSAGYEAGRFLMEKMKRHLIGGISFTTGVSAEELLRFVSVVQGAEAEQAPDPFAMILESMQQATILHIEVEALPEETEVAEVDRNKAMGGKPNRGKLHARLLYKKSARAMTEVMDYAGAGQTLHLRAAKRVVQHMIDLLNLNEVSLLGMTALRGRDGNGQNHATDVCVLSLMMGKRFGMTKFQLSALGMAALFHDIGKADLPAEILAKREALSTEERQALETHPTYGVKKIMQLKGLDVVSSRIVTGIFEHHMLADFSGYPRYPYERLSLFGRIIGIADSYLGLTTAKTAGSAPFSHDKAIRFLLSQAGKGYDRGLVKLFINCVGVHGIGSLVLLDSKELAVVVGNNADRTRWNNPLIRVIADARGQEVEREVGELCTRALPRKIVATRDPRLFKLDPGKYLL